MGSFYITNFSSATYVFYLCICTVDTLEEKPMAVKRYLKNNEDQQKFLGKFGKVEDKKNQINNRK